MFYDFWVNVYGSVDEYLGKTFTCSGMFDIFDYEGRTSYSVYHRDSSGCCTTGIEIDWTDRFISAEQDQCVTVTGVLDRYELDGTEYLILRLSDFKLQE